MNLMRCSGCGAAAKVTCGCNLAYIPAAQFASRAVARNPEKSDRAHAAELGISKNTVARARKSTGPKGPIEKRVGKDGRVRKLPARPPTAERVAKLQIQAARAQLVAATYGVKPILHDGREALLSALRSLGANHPVEQVRASLGVDWADLIVPALTTAAA